MEVDKTNEAPTGSPAGQDISIEIEKLKQTRDYVVYLKSKFDTVTLSKNIKNLQDASRVQGLRTDTRQTLLKELSRQQLIKQVLDGEPL